MKKIILALDVYNFEEACKFIDETKDFIDVFKVGPILFLNCGKEIINHINRLNKKVFLDLKFHDIPATVNRSIESAKNLGVFSLTIHSEGGREMLLAASEVKDRPKIWSVTVLTSKISSQDEIVKRAILSKDCGVDGVIASPLEISAIKEKCGKDFEVVTPGIRIEESNDDQKRIASPQQAIKDGADFIVIGRPIIKSQNPKAAAASIFKSIN
jgi:orotidine-5'-phosphate decarboxylase